MNQEKKANKITEVNRLLNELNQTVTENDQIKMEIEKAYSSINKPEKINQQFDRLHEAIEEMNYQFQQLALAKKYHFSPEQDKLINELKDLTKESMLQKGIGTINPAGW